MSLDITLYFPVDVGKDEPDQHVVYDANITHNLNKMASEAGVYDYVWRPDEHGVTEAGQIIQPLVEGIKRLRAKPADFRKFEPDNGWGTYHDFVPWLEKLLAACMEFPKASIRVSR